MLWQELMQHSLARWQYLIINELSLTQEKILTKDHIPKALTVFLTTSHD